ncbi:hypothetical protein TraAM80_05643 [Trypanosoma rangeli]|uniref:Uncharacterized protein n=1 Tax=Trypanosoma rangeli TaxID=5698 RepID=A0A3R7RIW7_TRYRA|nr:uncharacterized protein TraAM80_05643 [Trypanosoma rangeli]RNF03482.1 hypothetical protein TraAM80_05643 [Trypanosoma rangeli]|eukprot:RNF03482.1 hypothetical protein TraAM80_05643 [Trypanosoma rangeli]
MCLRGHELWCDASEVGGRDAVEVACVQATSVCVCSHVGGKQTISGGLLVCHEAGDGCAPYSFVRDAEAVEAGCAQRFLRHLRLLYHREKDVVKLGETSHDTTSSAERRYIITKYHSLCQR